MISFSFSIPDTLSVHIILAVLGLALFLQALSGLVRARIQYLLMVKKLTDSGYLDKASVKKEGV